MFLYSAISGAVVLLVALLVRLWWDLVEVYIVRNAMDGERRVRHALLPAFRLLFRYFFRTFGSFLLTGMLGVCALAVCLYLWNEFVPAHQVWTGFLLAQLGLFLLLASRFWQRGIEASLVMAVDPPIVAVDEVVEIGTARRYRSQRAQNLWQGCPNPRCAIWCKSCGLSHGPIRTRCPARKPGRPVRPADPSRGNEPEISLLDRHAKKFPLGGLSSDEEGGPANSAEKTRPGGDQEIPPETGKKP